MRRLETEAGSLWKKAINHRLFNEIKNNSVDKQVYINYLIIEYKFLNTAATTLGYALAKSPGFAYKKHFTEILKGITVEQDNYFINIADEMGFELHTNISNKAEKLTQSLHKHFIKTAQDEEFIEILVCMIGAEWLYYNWCHKAYFSCDIREPMQKWVHMHAEGDFVEGVEWLKSEINRAAEKYNDAGKNKLQTIFNTTLQAEIDFHHAPYYT